MIPAYQPYDSHYENGSIPLVVNAGASTEESSHPNLVATPATDSVRLSSVLPVSQTRVLLVLNQLAVMTQNGVEVAEALRNVTMHCQDRRLTRSLEAIHGSVSGGNTFSAALAAYGRYFPSTLAPMVAAAEATGEVPETLAQVCDRMRGQLEMRGALTGALIYPIILIGASSVVMSALLIGVLPQFSKVFTSMGRPVPPSTQLLLNIGDWCRAYWIYILPVLMAAMGSLVYFRNHTWIRRPIGRFFMYAPLIRNAYRPLAAGQNFRTIAAMVRGGVPLLQAIRLARRATGDAYWHRLLTAIEDNLIEGRDASDAMYNVDFLPPEAPQMMATGERTGRVGEVLEDIGTFYEQEGGRRIKRLVVAFEPVIILVMGVLVAGIVMSVMLPLLDVSTAGR
ncbi:MAG: type II secretion system F family protein [Pirellulaceae bacterium]|nr:type II secretion system F family protein [Pirellulaceae bacterium]